jgi:heavy metal efflux system protein
VSTTWQGGAQPAPVNVIHSTVVLGPESEWPDPDKTQPEIEDDIRRVLEDFPGMASNITQPIQLTVDEMIGGVKAELAIKLFGDDLDTLKAKGDEIAAVIREVDGAADVQAAQMVGAPQLLIRPDREALARYGVNLAEVQETIRAAVGGVEAGQVFNGIRRFNIYVRYQEPFRDTREDVARLLVPAPDGMRIPLDDLATIETLVGPPTDYPAGHPAVHHRAGQRGRARHRIVRR